MSAKKTHVVVDQNSGRAVSGQMSAGEARVQQQRLKLDAKVHHTGNQYTIVDTSVRK